MTVTVDGADPRLILQGYRRSPAELPASLEPEGLPLTLAMRHAEDLVDAIRLHAELWAKRSPELSLWTPARAQAGGEA